MILPLVVASLAVSKPQSLGSLSFAPLPKVPRKMEIFETPAVARGTGENLAFSALVRGLPHYSESSLPVWEIEWNQTNYYPLKIPPRSEMFCS